MYLECFKETKINCKITGTPIRNSEYLRNADHTTYSDINVSVVQQKQYQNSYDKSVQINERWRFWIVFGEYTVGITATYRLTQLIFLVRMLR
jgi:hypothetical protein